MTTFTVPVVRRVISSDMFADLGYPNVTITPVSGSLNTIVWEVSLVETLTVAQIQRARIRLKTTNSTDEATLVNALGPVVANIDTYLALAAPSQAQALAMVKTLAQDVRGIITWIGHDVTG